MNSSTSAKSSSNNKTSCSFEKNNQNQIHKLQNKYIFESSQEKKKKISKDLYIETVTDTTIFKKFYQFPFQLYKKDPNWVAPFWYEYKDFFNNKNPFWTHADCKLFMLKKNNKILGRIAALIDYKYCETLEKNIGFFGFFECINNNHYAEILFNTAQNWLDLKNMLIMRGPINGRVDVGCGFLIQGFNTRPCLLSSYSPPYYIQLAEHYGMKKTRDQFMYYIDLTKPLPKKLKEKAEQCRKSGITIRRFNRLQTKKELNWWTDFFLETFTQHWGYVPVPPSEVKTRFGVKQIRWFVDTKLFLIAEYNDTPVAYIWSTPDYNQLFQKMNGKLAPYQLMQFLLQKQKINIGKLPLIGIKKEFRNKNIGSYLNHLTLVEMKKRKYRGAEVGWIDEKNTAAHTTIAITGAQLYKKTRVYDIKIPHH